MGCCGYWLLKRKREKERKWKREKEVVGHFGGCCVWCNGVVVVGLAVVAGLRFWFWGWVVAAGRRKRERVIKNKERIFK